MLEGAIIAGPYHPAFGELVESRILLNRISEELDRMKLNKRRGIIIKARPELLSKAIGQNRSNIRALKERYNLSNVRVLPDINTKEYEIQVSEESRNEGECL